MSYYILGMPAEEYRKRITKKEILCIVSLLAVLACNILLCFFRTEGTHVMFLVLNIALDTIVCASVFFVFSTQIRIESKLYTVAAAESRARVLTGLITHISESTETVNGLECRCVTVDSESVRKVYAVAECAPAFTVTGAAVLTVVDHIIVRAEVQV